MNAEDTQQETLWDAARQEPELLTHKSIEGMISRHGAAAGPFAAWFSNLVLALSFGKVLAAGTLASGIIAVFLVSPYNQWAPHKEAAADRNTPEGGTLASEGEGAPRERGFYRFYPPVTSPTDVHYARYKNVAPHPLDIEAIPLLILSESELLRCGIVTDSNGVWQHYICSSMPTLVEAHGYSKKQHLFPNMKNRETYTGLHIPDNTEAPVLVTDDLGRWRSMYILPRLLDPELARRFYSADHMSAEERNLAESLIAKGERFVAAAINSFIPILVQTGQAYTQADSIAGHYRPDCILWFQASPAFLASLPIDWRNRLQAPVQPGDSDAAESGIAAYSVDTSAYDSANEIISRVDSVIPTTPVGVRDIAPRTFSIDLTADTVNLQPRRHLPRQVLARSATADVEDDDIRHQTQASPREHTNTQPGTQQAFVPQGETAAAMSQPAATPVLQNPRVYPNPARKETTVGFVLAEERTVTLTLHDIAGQQIGILMHSQRLQAGSVRISALLGNQPPGMYMISIKTDRGELAVQRLLIDR